MHRFGLTWDQVNSVSSGTCLKTRLKCTGVHVPVRNVNSHSTKSQKNKFTLYEIGVSLQLNSLFTSAWQTPEGFHALYYLHKYSQFDEFNTQDNSCIRMLVSNHLTYVYSRFVYPDRYIPLENLCRWE
jgi:hypothetical protein